MKQEIIKKLEKLNEETSQLYDSLCGLSERELHDNSYGWSIIQVFNHLKMAELGSVMYMKKKMKAGSKIPNFNVIRSIRYFFIKGLLLSRLKWKAPSVVANPKSDYSLDEIMSGWKKIRELIKSYIRDYPEDLLGKAVYKHPLAGRLDLAHAIDSFILHQRHHVHQVSRIRKKINH
ncbi:MAG: DinB family protein [Bacteroidota bacterium]